MRLTIVVAMDDTVVNVEVEDSETVQTLKAIIEAETGIQAAKQLLSGGGKLLTSDSSTLLECQLADEDVLSLASTDHAHGGSGIASGSGRQTAAAAAPPTDPAQFVEWIRGQPMLMTQLRQGANPPFLEAINAGDGSRALAIFTEIQRQHQHMKSEEERKRQEETDLWNADPMDIEAQTKIAERINEQQIAHTLEQAWEHNPEIFADVDMLYVEFEVNRHKAAAFVDSGAQKTIIGLQTAQTLGIAHLIDKRYAGIAKGVGSGRIVGRIHQAPMRVAGEYLATSLTVMENDDMPFLFGLDMMRRHQASINLKDNVLQFPHLAVSLQFLQPSQFPASTVGLPAGIGPEQPPETGSAEGPVTDSSSDVARLAGAAAATRAGASSSSAAAVAPPATGGATASAVAAAASSASGAVAGGGGARLAGGSSGQTDQQRRQDALRQQAAVLVSGLASTRIPVTASAAPSAQQTVPPQQARQASHPATEVAGSAAAATDSDSGQDSKVQQLMALGFTKAQVEEALTVCAGNVEHAAGFLYSV